MCVYKTSLVIIHSGGEKHTQRTSLHCSYLPTKRALFASILLEQQKAGRIFSFLGVSLELKMDGETERGGGLVAAAAGHGGMFQIKVKWEIFLNACFKSFFGRDEGRGERMGELALPIKAPRLL